jgi:omega-6 fatty acid desaturase (delta-12 desaturase)
MMRAAKELLIASKAFASEHRSLSWWYLWTTLAILGSLVACAVSDLPWFLRLPSSVLAGLVSVRMFVIYHDYQHQAILRDSLIADVIMTLYGLVNLNPPSVWNRSHDHHHRHNSKTFGASIGSFPVMTTHAYAEASPSEKFAYAAARHPLVIALGYGTVFFWGMSLRPFWQNPRKHFDGLLAITFHFGLMAYMATWGLDVVVLGLILPCCVSSILGSYLFYAQHNFPAAKLHERSEWSHVEAALHASSFTKMGPVMNWVTGNIGYHHVHHLNARIPFYRLPEAMHSLEELQSPSTTTLHPTDIVTCLQLKLWNPDLEKFVGFEAASDIPIQPSAMLKRAA